MPVARAAPRRLRLPLPLSYSGVSARQLHATARRPRSMVPIPDLPAKYIYHEFFPCTLNYYSWRGPTMAMHGSRWSESATAEMDPVERESLLGHDVVRIQEDGLVYPGPEGNDPVWNGAMLMPHATFLLEITQNWYDCYEEQKALGRDVPEPYFLTIPKGLRMPNTLLLAYENAETFYLMPRIGMPLSALNRELNSLFSSSGCSKLPFYEYFKKYTALEAWNTRGEDEFMCK